MLDQTAVAEQFEAHRGHLRAVAYRMLGSHAEVEDALQEAWLRFSRADTSDVDNLGGWLTTVTARVCLNLLRARDARREQPLEVHVPDPVVSRPDALDPEQEALLGDSVGLALLVVLDTLAPDERLAFVLHDLFGVPFDEIAPIVERAPAATRQLASRARRRVAAEAPPSDPDRARQRKVVDAFFAAAREGDFAALVALLHPDVVSRGDGGTLRLGATHVARGAQTVAGRAVTYAHLAPYIRPALVNGVAGAVVVPERGTFAIMAFTVRDDRIVAIDALVDPARLAGIDVSAVAA